MSDDLFSAHLIWLEPLVPDIRNSVGQMVWWTTPDKRISRFNPLEARDGDGVHEALHRGKGVTYLIKWNTE